MPKLLICSIVAVSNYFHLIAFTAPFNRGNKSSIVTQDASHGEPWAGSHPYRERRTLIPIDRLQQTECSLPL